jgi:hypothetical protein
MSSIGGVLPDVIRSYRIPRGEVPASPLGHKWTIMEAALAATATLGCFDSSSIDYQGSLYQFRDAAT